MGWSNVVSQTNSQDVALEDAASNCPICDCRLTDDIARCPRCSLVYHYPCWSLASGCPSCGYDTKRLLPSGANHLQKRLSLLLFLTNWASRLHSSVWVLALLLTISLPIVGQGVYIMSIGSYAFHNMLFDFYLSIVSYALPLLWIFVLVLAIPLGFVYRHLMNARTRWPGRLPLEKSPEPPSSFDLFMAKIPLWLGFGLFGLSLFNILIPVFGGYIPRLATVAFNLIFAICFVVAPNYVTHLLLDKRATMLAHLRQFTTSINERVDGMVIGVQLPIQRPKIALPQGTPKRHNLDQAARCPVCGCDVQHRAVLCPTCDTPHHQDCWEYTGTCAIFGCPGAAGHEQEHSEKKPPRRSRSISSVALPVMANDGMVSNVQRWLFTLKGHFVSFVLAVAGIQLLLWSRVLPSSIVQGDAVISFLAAWAPSFLQGGLVLTIVGLFSFLLFTWKCHRQKSHIEESIARSNSRPISTRTSFEWASALMGASFVGLITWTLAWAFVIPVMAANQPAAWAHQLTLVDMVAFIAVGTLLPLVSLSATRASVNKAQELQRRLNTYVPRIGRRRSITEQIRPSSNEPSHPSIN